MGDLKRCRQDQTSKRMKAISIMEDKLLQMQMDGGRKSEEFPFSDKCTAFREYNSMKDYSPVIDYFLELYMDQVL